MRRQTPAFLVGQGFQNTPGLSLRRQDAFDGTEGVGAEAYGPLQSGQHVGPRIGAQQGQDLDGLVPAVTLAAQQAVQEALRLPAPVRRSVPAASPRLGAIRAGRWAVAHGVPRLAARGQVMAGDLLDLRTVDDQFRLGDAHRQRLADVTPGHRVAILPVDDVALDVDHAVYRPCDTS